MADGYGNTVQHWRCHVAAWVVSQTESACTIRCQTRFQSLGWGYYVYGNGSVSAAGSSASSGTVLCQAPTGGWVDQTLATRDVTVARKGSAQSIAVSGTVQLTGGYHNGTSTASTSVTVPAIVYKKPRKPKDFKATRGSDVKTTLTWGADYTDSNGFYPWSGLHLYRSVDGGALSKLCDLGWSATSYVDNTTRRGHSYQWAIRSWNGPGGESDAATSAVVRMTPAALSALNAAKESATAIRLTIPSAPAYYDSIEFQRKEQGGSYAGISPAKKDGYWLDSGVPEKVLIYRARVVYGDMRGDWAESASIAAVCAPNAPSVDAPDPVYANGSTVLFSWRPNHPDKTAQSAAQVAVTVGDGAAKVIDVSGTATACKYAASENGDCKARVRTKGLSATWGAWSAYKSFEVADPPSAEFTAPAADGGVVAGLPLKVAWTVADETGVSAQALKVSEDFSGKVVSASTPAASARSAEFGVSTGIKDGAGYTLTLTVRGGSGLESTATRRFVAKWSSPLAPALAAVEGDGKAVYVGVAAEEGGIAADHLRLVRVNPDGTASALGDALKSGDAVADRLPPLNVGFSYRLAAVAASGATSYTELPFRVDSDDEVWNYGPAAASYVPLGLSLDASSSIEPTGEEFEFAGQSLPRFYADNRRDSSVSRSYDVATRDEAEAVRAMAQSCPKLWLRDVFGHVRYGHAKWSFSYSADKAHVYGVSADFTELEWEEPLSG